MTQFILITAIVLVAFFLLWLAFSGKKGPVDAHFEEDLPVTHYSCPQCGEHHCNCYENKQKDKTQS